MTIHLQRRTWTAGLGLAAALLASAAPAAPPATVATCAGIAAAYPILGGQCTTNYAKINHAPATAAQRLETYTARKAVLIVFRKALLCNGMYNASKAAQAAFKSGEAGHQTALDNLRTAMIGAGDTDPGAYDPSGVTIKKLQCK